MALFGLFCAVITMVARQLIVFALVLTAPIAIACWVLPNTEKLFKKWSFNLFRVLAMFPMVTGLIATAILFLELPQPLEELTIWQKLQPLLLL